MKRPFVCACFLILSSFILRAQDKPQVFVQVQGAANGSGSGKMLGVLAAKSAENSEGAAVEFGKDLGQDCAAAAIASDAKDVDYKITLTPPEKKKSDLRSNSQVQIANRAGKVVGTNFMHTSGNAVKDACELIDADWKAHGRISATSAPAVGDAGLTPGVTAPPASAPAIISPAATLSTSAGLETSSSTGIATGGSGVDGESMGDAARRAKLHAACLKSARENPDIRCK